MKREFLKGLELSEEQIDRIMAEYGRSVERFKEDGQTIAQLNDRLEEANRELAALRGAPGTSVLATSPKKAVPWVRSGLRLVLYAVAVAFIVLGVMNGGLRDVLVKAINICTECIGLG